MAEDFTVKLTDWLEGCLQLTESRLGFVRKVNAAFAQDSYLQNVSKWAYKQERGNRINPVCQFFLRGQCKFGDSCRNEHPADSRQSGFGGNSWNNNRNASSNAAASGTSAKSELPYNDANIRNDLDPKTEKPIWPLSCYAPFKGETTLIEGLDISPEEMRVKAAEAVKRGNIAEYTQYESNQIAAAEQAYNNVRTNLQQALEQAKRQSRLVSNAAASSSSTSTNAFASGSGSTSAFGGGSNAGSVFGSTSTPSAFAGGTFGATTTPSVFGGGGSGGSSFGAPNPTPSVFGSTPTPSAFGSSSTPSAFGSTATTSTNAFGKPAFGQPAFGQSAFGQPTASTLSGPPTTTNTFGQSAFGQPAAPATSATSTFGQASTSSSSLVKPASGAFGAFAGSGASSFGAGATPSAPSTSAGGGGFSAFAGQPAAFGSGAPATNGSGGSVFGHSAFSQPSTSTTTGGSVFGQPQTPQTQNAFGALAGKNPSTNTSNVFGTFGGAANPSSNVFGATNTNTANPLNPTATTSTNPPSTMSAFAPINPTGSSSTLTVPASVPGGITPSISMASANSGGSGGTNPFGGGTSGFGGGVASAFGNNSGAFGGGPFGAGTASPMSVFGGPSPVGGFSGFGSNTSTAAPPKPIAASVTDSTLDFSAMLASLGPSTSKSALYKPGSTPYDSQLPSNYAEMLPKRVGEAFKMEKFVWGWVGLEDESNKKDGVVKGVPEWVPPVDVR
ncbi:hypothetical protein CPB83DRAFT_836171 [Crepidotus variabilis]|uniref:C3H1-type domain-containing protein n=1 Tax=Crepidotus variabilis TaxID=179855 RepID=A0A9P6JPX6_9AGAR|nr:hypothetical protein CPB83DRAFT_836171 [Crepidotus variabilis]